MKDNYMAGDAVGTYSQDLAHIKSAIGDLTIAVSEIKELLRPKDESICEHGNSLNSNCSDCDNEYPWHFPNVTTTVDYHEEEG